VREWAKGCGVLQPSTRVSEPGETYQHTTLGGDIAEQLRGNRRGTLAHRFVFKPREVKPHGAQVVPLGQLRT